VRPSWRLAIRRFRLAPRLGAATLPPWSSAACSTVIDRFGLIGLRQHAASRLVGMVLMAATVTWCASSERRSRPPFRPIDSEIMP
jgi:uncharacterized membrane protein YdcZ (DUF606 family)